MMKAMIAIFIGFTLVTTALPSVSSEIKPVDAKLFFENSVDTAINHCRHQCVVESSPDSSNDVLANSCHKITFLKAHKSEMVVALLKRNVPNDAYVVNYYLNNWFYTYQKQWEVFLTSQASH